LCRVPAAVPAALIGAGLTGKAAKLGSRALTDKLKALSRSPAKGGLQPYRDPDTQGGVGQLSAAGRSHQVMTAEQLQEQEEMEAELEQVRTSNSHDSFMIGSSEMAAVRWQQ
jgi:homoserine kinase